MKPGYGTQVMQDFCSAEGGSVAIQSAPGRGATITAKFPKPRDARAPMPPEVLPPRQASRGTSPARVTTVLLVDDQPDFCAYLLELFKPHADLRIAGIGHDGQEAVRLAGTHQPDAILMDVEMPRKDGLTAAREIRAISPETIVILMSARHDADFAGEAKAAGAAAFIPKRDLSMARVREALGGASLLREGRPRAIP
jgi:CheY-like chemotaxis protein